MVFTEKLRTRYIEFKALLRLLPLLPQISPKSTYTPSKYVSKHSVEKPNAIALRFLDKTWSWSQFDEEISRAALAYVSIGVKRGDKVVLLIDNRPEFLICMLALSRLQAVAVLLNTSVVGKSLAHCINVSKAGLIIVGAEHVDKITAILSDLIQISAAEVWELNDPYEQSVSSTEVSYNDFDELLSSVDITCAESLIDDGKTSIMDECCYIYTSGTTGLPKAAIVTNQRLTAMGIFFGRYMVDMKPTETMYASSPLYHTMG